MSKTSARLYQRNFGVKIAEQHDPSISSSSTTATTTSITKESRDTALVISHSTRSQHHCFPTFTSKCNQYSKLLAK